MIYHEYAHSDDGGLMHLAARGRLGLGILG